MECLYISKPTNEKGHQNLSLAEVCFLKAENISNIVATISYYHQYIIIKIYQISQSVPMDIISGPKKEELLLKALPQHQQKQTFHFFALSKETKPCFKAGFSVAEQRTCLLK